VFPLPAASEATLALNLEERIEDASLTLINAKGQMVRPLYRGALVEAGHQLVVAKAHLPAGTYWLQLSDGNQLVNRQVIFR